MNDKAAKRSGAAMISVIVLSVLLLGVSFISRQRRQLIRKRPICCQFASASCVFHAKRANGKVGH